eukprot:3522316-Alexandrium_andersonii.AAC.1
MSSCISRVPATCVALRFLCACGRLCMYLAPSRHCTCAGLLPALRRGHYLSSGPKWQPSE